MIASLADLVRGDNRVFTLRRAGSFDSPFGCNLEPTQLCSRKVKRVAERVIINAVHPAVQIP